MSEVELWGMRFDEMDEIWSGVRLVKILLKEDVDSSVKIMFH